MTAVDSASVAKVGYDEATKTLAVAFHGASIYHYEGVPKDVFDGLMKAKSIGKHLQANVVGKYKHKRI